VKRLSTYLLILISLFALVLAGCNTTTPAPTDPTTPTDPLIRQNQPTLPIQRPTDPDGGGFTLTLEPATLSLAPVEVLRQPLRLPETTGLLKTSTLP
jgi:hypothetical protein